MLSGPSPTPRPTQNQFEIMCLKALVASNWSFRQFDVGPFRDLLAAGFGLQVPTPKVMKARLKVEANRA